MRLAGFCLRRQLEVAFPGDGSLLSARRLVPGEEFVFEDECVSLLCNYDQRNLEVPNGFAYCLLS